MVAGCGVLRVLRVLLRQSVGRYSIIPPTYSYEDFGIRQNTFSQGI